MRLKNAGYGPVSKIALIGENLTYLAEDWCVDYSNTNILSGPCCGFYVTSMYTAVPIPVVPAHNASAASEIEGFLTVFPFKRQHLSIVLHGAIQRCSLPCTFKIGYTSIHSGSTCQIINFFCNILSDVLEQAFAFTLEDVEARGLWDACSECCEVSSVSHSDFKHLPTFHA